MLSTRRTCRACGCSSLLPILSLGNQYVSDFVESETGFRAPLKLVLCNPRAGGCGLLQLEHTVDRDSLYRQYWYKSGINETMIAHLGSIAKEAEARVGLTKGDYVIDIGANDGTLLRFYPRGIHTVGFEPAKNLVGEAQVGTSAIINDFFNYKTWETRFGSQKARAITAIAMFYDLEDPNPFVEDLKRCLAPDGVVVVQQNYLPGMLAQNAFDNIVHEHLEYYSLLSLEPLLERHGLEVVDVEENDLNGGSFRTYIMHEGTGSPTAEVHAMREREKAMRLDTPGPYRAFADRVEGVKRDLHTFIASLVQDGKTVYAYGPGTRGNTLLQACGLDHRLIQAAAERNPAKWGRRTVGTNIPIISEERARRDNPDYFLILPWAFVETFEKREREYLEGGGQFIVPLPEFHRRGTV